MKNKFFAFFIACAFVLNAAGTAFADTKAVKTQNQLLALLPASDGVVSVDAKRFFNVALPQILSGNKPMLDEVNGKIDDFKAKTSIDLRQFEQIAVGVASKQISATETDFEPIVLARGNFNAGALLTLAKFASSGTYKEEKIGSRTVYVFSTKQLIEKNKPANSTFIQKVIDNIVPRLSGETAVTAYDNNTLAFGSVERVRLMLTNSKSRVDAGLLAMANRNPNAVVSFAANLPRGLSDFIDLADDDLGKNLSSIRQLYGTMDVAGENTVLSVSAKTVTVEQATNLKQSFESLQMLFADFLLGSRNNSQKAYGRMLKSVKFSRTGSELGIDLQVPQSDINVLIGAK